jgi:oligopeptide/dipeptide ABC transporter ATP-binding protein
MYLGEIVETGNVQELYSSPKHPYTKALIKAIPQPIAGANINFVEMQSDVPSPINPPSGCRFHPCCLHATEQCSKLAPKPEKNKITMSAVITGGQSSCYMCSGVKQKKGQHNAGLFSLNI